MLPLTTFQLQPCFGLNNPSPVAAALPAGVSKSELLDREAGDMAVRMALGETHVIAETKRALGDAGKNSKLPRSAGCFSFDKKQLGCWEKHRCL